MSEEIKKKARDRVQKLQSDNYQPSKADMILVYEIESLRSQIESLQDFVFKNLHKAEKKEIQGEFNVD